MRRRTVTSSIPVLHAPRYETMLRGQQARSSEQKKRFDRAGERWTVLGGLAMYLAGLCAVATCVTLTIDREWLAIALVVLGAALMFFARACRWRAEYYYRCIVDNLQRRGT